MTPTQTGRCQCGAVTYRFDGDPVMIYACHCTLCQRQSASAFGMAVVVNGADFKLSGTRPVHFVRSGHGREFRCYFCPDCGTRIYHQWYTAEGDYSFLSVKPGTLDDTSWLKPGCHVWAQHAQPWVRFGDDEVVFAQQPSLDAMPKYADR